MGRDKFENENLIEYGFPEDIWFHVDNLSSAHVYLRPPRPWDDPSFSIEAIPPDVLSDMCQLTKANSIEGSKQSSVDIVYTPWGNLRKDQNTMDTGTVGFQDMKLVFKKKDVKRDKDILKRIEKTKKESFPDFAKEKEARDVEERHQKKKVLREQKQEQKEEQKRKEEERKVSKAHTHSIHYTHTYGKEGWRHTQTGSGHGVHGMAWWPITEPSAQVLRLAVCQHRPDRNQRAEGRWDDRGMQGGRRGLLMTDGRTEGAIGLSVCLAGCVSVCVRVDGKCHESVRQD
mmetsp:Transcript_45084/g.127249  ORF Transcript_45084/g.127249 Transcript_45084/m.127249 type:complete len:287 (+) Transcript_45084:179-1039(+)